MRKILLLLFALSFLSCDGQDILYPQKTQHEIGTLFTDDFANLNNWTSVGSGSFTPGGTGLIIGNTAANYNNYITYNQLINSYEDFLMYCEVEVLSVGILSMGIETERSVSGSHRKSFMGSWIGGATNGRVVIATYNDGTSTVVTNVADANPATLNYAVGDILNFSFRRNNINDYTTTIVNQTSGLQSTTTFNTIPTAGVVAGNNAGKFKIHSITGSYRIIPGTFRVSTTSRSSIRALFIGDSRTTFMKASPATNRFANRVFSGSNRRFEVNAGAYDVTGSYSTQQTCIDSYRADFVFICGLGRNDIFYGISSGTYQTNYTTIRNNAASGGARVVHVLFPNDASATVTSLNSWITSTFTSDIIIDLSGNTYTYADGVHFTNTDHQNIANSINSAMPYLNGSF